MIYSSFRGTGDGPLLCRIPLRLTYCLGAHTGSSNPRPSTDIEGNPPHPSEGAKSLEPPRRHQGGSRRLVSKVRREPPSLPSLAAWDTPSPLATGPVAICSRRTLAPRIQRSRPLLSRNRRLGPSGTTPSRRGGRKKKKSVRGKKKREKKKNRATCREDYHKRRRRSGLLGILNANRKNPQAHGYRCSLHPGVFQSIDFPQRM